jgi:hypothetical protein
MTSVSPTFMDFIRGIVKIGNIPLVVDNTHRVDSSQNLKLTSYGIRHDPKNEIDPSAMVDSIIDLFYRHYKLRENQYTNMRFKFVLVIYKFTGSDLQPNTKLIPSSDHIISKLMSMYDVITKDDDFTNFVASVKSWLTEKIGESKLIQIRMQVEDYGK